MKVTWDVILKSKLINKAELARLMWPDNKFATKKFENKIAGRAGQRLTDHDKELIEAVFFKEFLTKN